MDMDPPDLKPIKAHLLPLVGSLKKSALSTGLSAKTDAETAVQRAQILLGCYRKDDAADPETYAGAVAAVLAEYPPDIVQRVTDPRSGLPSRLAWLPSVKEVNVACEELDARQRRIADAAEREREQLADRAREAKARTVRPTLQEMQAKHGPNWGLQEHGAEAEAQRAERVRLRMMDANRAAFVAECRSAGFSLDSPISPSLSAIMQKRVG